MREIRMVCVACGAEPDPLAGEHPFRCPDADEAKDHLLARRVHPSLADGAREAITAGVEVNPFVRFRRLLLSHALWRAAGASDAGFVALVRRLDRQVAAVEGHDQGHGFVGTPCAEQPALATAAGVSRLWVKDETVNVSGSHKARHQFGVLLYLEVARELGLLGERVAGDGALQLAVASCGNAALAAAVVARAAGHRLRVFVPPAVDPTVRSRLLALEAEVVVCPRREHEAGDPCYLRFREALAAGALPLSVQGNENGLTIEGGMTLAFELLGTLARAGEAIDRLVVQVGGGALASACVQALREAQRCGLVARLPRLHAVQTSSAAPLARAHQRIVARLLGQLPGQLRQLDLASRPSQDLARVEAAASRLAADELAAARSEQLARAAADRRAFMWPWESEPQSMAHGILDDETYDWHAVCAGMLDSGGYPVTVDEATLAEAHRLGRQLTGIDVDPTGSAGLAGLLLLGRQVAAVASERVALLFTGRQR